MASNTLGEFSDGEDDFVFEIDENLWSDPQGWEWSDPQADDIIRNINEEEVLARVYQNDDVENSWGDPKADDLIRNINEEEVLARACMGMIMTVRIFKRFRPDVGRNGRMKATWSQRAKTNKAKTNKGNITINWKAEGNTTRKNFGMTATDHRVRFNNVLADRDLLESYETTHKIFHHLLEDVKEGMAPNDQVRFILRSEQLETPISLPFYARRTSYYRTGLF